MNDPPLVSVIIPTYNYGAYIGECLDSVLGQHFNDYEVLLADDGSKDDTPQIVERSRAKFGGRLNYMRYGENQGVYRVRNLALRAARGRYIAFLDADDIWEPQALAELVAHMETHPDDKLAYANTKFFYSDSKKELGHNFGAGSRKTPHRGRCADKLFLEGNFIPFMTTILRREVFDEVGLFDETLKVGGDYDLFLRVACLYPVGYVDKVLCRVRRHDRNLSFKTQLQSISQIRVLKKAAKFFLRHGYAVDPAGVRRRWAQIYYEFGIALFLKGKPKQARLAFRKYLSLKPSFFSNKILLYFLLSFLPAAGAWKRLRTSLHVMREKLKIRNR